MSLLFKRNYTTSNSVCTLENFSVDIAFRACFQVLGVAYLEYNVWTDECGFETYKRSAFITFRRVS